MAKKGKKKTTYVGTYTYREKGQLNQKYLATGKAYIFGIGNTAAKQRIDQVIAQESSCLRDALLRWNIDESDINLIAPISYFTRLGYIWKDKKDKKIRASNYSDVIIAFGENQLYMYEKGWSTVNYSFYVETHEYFYKDITSVGINQSNMQEVTEERRFFKTNFKSKDIFFYNLWFNIGGKDIVTPTCESTLMSLEQLQGAVALIRQKKLE